MKRIPTIFVSVLLIGIILAGCLPEEAPISKRIDLNFNVARTGLAITDGTDSVTVNEIKMAMDRFIVDTDGDARLESRPNTLIFRYTDSNAGNDEQVFAGSFGFAQFDVFSGMEIFLEPVQPEDSIGDPDLFEDGDGITLFFSGQFNGEAFEYKSTFVDSVLFDFSSNVELNEDRETLKIRLLSDISDFLIDPVSDNIISPVDDANRSKIDSLYKIALQLEATAEQSIPFN